MSRAAVSHALRRRHLMDVRASREGREPRNVAVGVEMEPRINLFENEIGGKFTKRFANTSLVVHQSSLPRSTHELVSLRVSQINGCGFCIDMHTKEAVAAGESSGRPNLVAAWRESPVFFLPEQAAPAPAGEGPRVADASPGVSDETWAHVRKHYDEDQIAALVCLVSLVNAANRLAVIVHQQGGSYQAGMFDAATA